MYPPPPPTLLIYLKTGEQEKKKLWQWLHTEDILKKLGYGILVKDITAKSSLHDTERSASFPPCFSETPLYSIAARCPAGIQSH